MKRLLTAYLSFFGAIRRFWLKLSGRSEQDVHNTRVISGKTWEDFCEGLKAAGNTLVLPGAPQDPMSQAEGIRYLSRLTRAGLEAFVEFNDPMYPEFRRTVHETIKMGADNPDNHYLNAQIDGRLSYVITGKRNSIHYFGLFTQNGNYGTTGGLAPCGKLSHTEMEYEADGSFEIHLAPEPTGKNWLKCEPETSLVMVRQTYRDREHEEPADFAIRCLNPEGIPGSITPKRIDQNLEMVNLFVAGAPLLFAKWAKGFQSHSNQLPLFDPEKSNAAGGDAEILYYHSYWRLQDDEALVIETPVIACESWNFQLNNHWMESLDYRYHRICINDFEAEVNDGKVRVVVSAFDPGTKNWIQTAGHREGTMCWRWYRPTVEVPKEIPCRVVSKAVLSE